MRGASVATRISTRGSLRGDACDQVVERVAMLGEDHQFAALALRIEHLRVVEHGAQLLPLAVGTRVADAFGERGQLFQRVDLRPELLDGA